MPEGQTGMSRLVVAAALVVVLLLCVGGAAVAKLGPFAQSGLTKPTDARQAIVDAVGRTANFKDVKYTATFDYSSATSAAFNSTSQVSATGSPVMIDIKNHSSSGKGFESIQNGAKQVFCTMPEGGPNQRFPNQTIPQGSADPFYDLVKSGTNWRFLADADVSGHKAWHLMADLPKAINGPNPNNIKFDINTTEVWIDSLSGKIQKRLDYQTGSENGAKYHRTNTDTNFVYNAGVTIPTCE